MLQHLIFQRVTSRSMSIDAAAEAHHKLLQLRNTWDDRISLAHYTGSLGNALYRFVQLSMLLSNPSVLRLPQEGIVDCCGVCKHGHEGALAAAGVLDYKAGVPVLEPAPHLEASFSVAASEAEASSIALVSAAS